MWAGRGRFHQGNATAWEFSLYAVFCLVGLVSRCPSAQAMSCVRFSHALRTGRCTSRSSRLLSPQARGFCRPGSIIYRDLKQKDNKYNPCFAHFAIYTGDVGPYKACAIGANPGGIQILGCSEVYLCTFLGFWVPCIRPVALNPKP